MEDGILNTGCFAVFDHLLCLCEDVGAELAAIRILRIVVDPIRILLTVGARGERSLKRSGKEQREKDGCHKTKCRGKNHGLLTVSCHISSHPLS